jgi:hypothetical protein
MGSATNKQNLQQQYVADVSRSTREARAEQVLRSSLGLTNNQEDLDIQSKEQQQLQPTLSSAETQQREEDHVFAKTKSRFFILPSCPNEPVYPITTRLVDLLENWSPDNVTIPSRHHNTLCRFNYRTDLAQAKRYRDSQVPFVIYNVPELDTTAAKWSTPGYLEERLGANQTYDVEISKTNHFLYYSRSHNLPADYDPPTHVEKWTYGEWLAKVQQLEESRSSSSEPTAAAEHYYFRASDINPPIKEDMALFSTRTSNFFVPEPSLSKGVHCRFGAPAVLADAHYDGHNNMVACLAGTRRWILAPPKECRNAYLRPPGDPSARHSEVNFSSPDLEMYPKFGEMQGLETILTAGEVLYVPSFWIHFIANLGVNAQCNVRGAKARVGGGDVAACGFY